MTESEDVKPLQIDCLKRHTQPSQVPRGLAVNLFRMMGHHLSVYKCMPLQLTFETFGGKYSERWQWCISSHSPFQYSEPMKMMNNRNWGPPTTLIVRNVVVTEKAPTMLRPKLSERLLSIPAST